MLTSSSRRWVVTFGLLALALLSASAQAQVTFSGPSNITLTEDGSPHAFFYTVTNNSGGPITDFGVTGTLFGSASGDLLEVVSTGESVGTCFNLTLANGASCDFVFSIVTDDGSGETDADSWTASGTFGAVFNFASGGPGTVLESVVATVSDPTPTPEPSSFLLLGSGVLGMLGSLRRKLRC